MGDRQGRVNQKKNKDQDGTDNQGDVNKKGFWQTFCAACLFSSSASFAVASGIWQQKAP